MKTKLGCVLIISFFITNYCYSNEIKNYNCNINLSTNIKNISPLEMSAPKLIKVIYNSETNKLIDYIWNNKSVVDNFELVQNNNNFDFIEIGRKDTRRLYLMRI